MAEYIEIELESDENELAELGYDRLRDVWEDWEPSQGDLETLMVQVISTMAAEAAEVAASVPMAVFTAILEDLHGIFRRDGQPAVTTVTFTLADDDPHVIPAGYEMSIDGWAFTCDVATSTAATVVPGVAVTCSVSGAEANGLLGDLVEPLTALTFVESISVDQPTVGGVDLELEDDFADRGVLEMQLQAKTLVTTRDYDLMAMSVPSVSRVVTLANSATRTVQVFAATVDGSPLPAPEKTKVLALLEEYRLSTWTVSMADPQPCTINVTFSLVRYPNTLPEDVEFRAEEAVKDFLDPQAWGMPLTGEPGTGTPWENEPTVRKNKLIDVIGSVQGVDYVEDVTITGSTGSAQPNGDWLMPGTMPLPRPGTITGTV